MAEDQIGSLFDEAGTAEYYPSDGKRLDYHAMIFDAGPAYWEAYEGAYAADGSLTYTQVPAVGREEVIRESSGQYVLIFQSEARGPAEVADAEAGGAADGSNEWAAEANRTLPGPTTVVAFRGTESTGDSANMLFFGASWFADRTVAQMRRLWEWRGLTWTRDLEARGKVRAEWGRIMFVLGTYLQMTGFVDSLAADREGSPDVPRSELALQGYWPLTKALVDSVLDDHAAAGGAAEDLYFTGQSQGGMMAALASLYAEKSRGQRVETVTFSATGGACLSRALGWPTADGANLLDDVDPYVVHSQVTDYADVNDYWGNLDVDPGRTCYYGLSREREAFAQCGAIQGFTGPVLMAAFGSAPGIPGEVGDAFARCRYLTHFWSTYSSNLFNESLGYLYDNGTTDGGCLDGGVWGVPSAADPDDICPRGGLSAEMRRVTIVVCIIAVTIGAALLIFVLFCAWCCFRRACCGTKAGSRDSGPSSAAVGLL